MVLFVLFRAVKIRHQTLVLQEKEQLGHSAKPLSSSRSHEGSKRSFTHQNELHPDSPAPHPARTAAGSSR